MHTMFQNSTEAGERLADSLEASGRDFAGFTVFAVNQDGLHVAHPIAERLGLSVMPLAVKEFSLCGTYLTATSFCNGRIHSGMACEDGQEGCCFAPNLMALFGESDPLFEELFQATMALNLGRPIFVPSPKAFLVIDELGDGHRMLAAIDSLRQHGVEEIIVVTPVGERWMCDALDVECVALASVIAWELLPEDFGGFYATMPILPDQLAAFTVQEFGASWLQQ